MQCLALANRQLRERLLKSLLQFRPFVIGFRLTVNCRRSRRGNGFQCAQQLFTAFGESRLSDYCKQPGAQVSFIAVTRFALQDLEVYRL